MGQPSSLEEVDNIIAQQVVLLETDSNACVITLIDDTDIFILLLYFYSQYSLQSAIFMESPVYQHSCVGIKVKYLSSIVSLCQTYLQYMLCQDVRL